MDVLRREVNRFLLKSVEDLLTIETVISGLSSSHSHTPTEKEYRGRKSHIPSVTTVPRADTLASGDRQARRRHTAVREGQTKKTIPLPAVTPEKTIVADAGLFHRTPNNVEDRATGQPLYSGRRAGQRSRLPAQGGSAQGHINPQHGAEPRFDPRT